MAVVALVAVLVVALLAYHALAPQRGASATLGVASGEAADTLASPDQDGDASASAQGSDPGASSGEGVKRGPQLADFDATVYDEFGDARTLTGIADGKPLVMNFWATWCPYCVQEMGDYQEIYNEYGDRVSFAFIDVADGQREKVEDGASWLFEHEYTLPAYYDTTLEAMYAYGATNLPTTVVVAADGEILDVSAGAIDPELMRSALDSLLAS